MIYLIIALVVLGLASALIGLFTQRKGEEEPLKKAFRVTPVMEKTRNASRSA